MAIPSAVDAADVGDGVDGSLEASLTASAAAMAAAAAAAGAENAAMGRPPRGASDSFEPLEELFEPEAVQPGGQGPGGTPPVVPAREISVELGLDPDKKLIEAITEGLIETPPVLSWGSQDTVGLSKQAWRRGAGGIPRPSKGDSDFEGIPNRVIKQRESALWSSVMEELHGPDWKD